MPHVGGRGLHAMFSWAWLGLFLCGAAACGDIESSGSASDLDATPASDVSLDVTVDAARDAAPDVTTVDATTDASPDVAVDAARDAAPDVTIDAGLDAPPDVGADVIVPVDAPPDAPPPVDAAPDAPPPTFTIGGNVAGLAGTGMVLEDNLTNDLPVTQNGPFTFTNALATGQSYSVTVKTQPSSPTQACSVANATGTVAAANVTNVGVSCCGIVAPQSLIASQSPVVLPATAAGQGIVHVADSVALDGTSSTNPNNTAACPRALAYAWTLVRPNGSSAALSSATAPKPTFTADVAGVYEADLVVTDGVIAGTTARFVFTTFGFEAGPYSAVAVDPSAGGAPIIAYYDASNPQNIAIRVLRCASSCGTASPNWLPPLVVDQNIGGTDWSVQETPRPLDLKVAANGQMWVAYHRETDCAAVVAGYDATAGVWRKTAVEKGSGCNTAGTAGKDLGRWVSLALSSGTTPALAYFIGDVTGMFGAARYAICTDAACLKDNATWSAPLSVQGTPQANTLVGRWIALTYVAGNLPRVAYYVDIGPGGGGGVRTALYYGECDDAPTCATDTTSWANGIVSAVGGQDDGRYATIRAAGDRPRIAFRSSQGGQHSLNYASCSGTCVTTANWTIVTVEQTQTADYARHVALDLAANGTARVAYFAAAGAAGILHGLRYAQEPNPPGAFTFVAADSTSGTVGQAAAIAVTASGGAVITHWDSATNTLKYTAQ